MGQWVGVAKAARMLSIKRTDLQSLIQRGDLHTFEGKVDLDELRACYPSLLFEDTNIIERTKIIRDSAYERRVLDTFHPSEESLKKQIRRLKTDLSIQSNTANSYRLLIEDLLEKLNQMQQQSSGGTLETVSQINHWLLERFKSSD